MMNWWQNMVVPIRRVWLAVAGRVKPRDNGQPTLLSVGISNFIYHMNFCLQNDYKNL